MRSKNFEAWANQAIILGLPSILFGILPFYIASYSLHLTEPPFNSRFAVGMLPGAALLTAAVIEKLVTKRNLMILVSAVVLSVAVNWHIRYTNDFRRVWAYQADMLQQLTWRVPGIEKDTAVFVWQPALPNLENSNAGIAMYGDFALSMAVNSIYDPKPNSSADQLPYWYYFLSGDQVEVSPAAALHVEHATTHFDGNTSNSLMFYYDPQNNQCLHLITPDDKDYKRYPEAVNELAALTNLQRVLAVTRQDTTLRDEILDGSNRTWCFYYQKADAARQFGQWDQIPALWQGVTENSLNTAFGPEYLPFIEGLARTGEWQKAVDVTRRANKISQGMDSLLCPLWDDLKHSTPAAGAKDEALKKAQAMLGCAVP